MRGEGLTTHPPLEFIGSEERLSFYLVPPVFTTSTFGYTTDDPQSTVYWFYVLFLGCLDLNVPGVHPGQMLLG